MSGATLQEDWNYMYIVLSYIVSVSGAFATFQLMHALRFTKRKLVILASCFGAAITFGIITVWSMHFIGMVGLRVKENNVTKDIYFDPWITFASLACIIGGVFVALLIYSLHLFIPALRMRRTCLITPQYVYGIIQNILEARKQKALHVQQADDFLDVTTTHGGDEFSVGTPHTPSASHGSVGEDQKAFARSSRSLKGSIASVSTTRSARKLRSLFTLLDPNARKQRQLKSEHRMRKRQFRSPHIIQIIVGGLFMGLGITSMHYIGMLGMQNSINVEFTWYFVMITSILACIAGVVVLYLSTILRSDVQDIGASVIVGLACCLVHMMGMFGTDYTAKSGVDTSVLKWSPYDIALVVAMISFSVCLFSIVFILNAGRKKASLDYLVNQQTFELREEKKKSEHILNNILPASIVKRMRSGETTICDVYNNVSITFVDIVGFTKMGNTISSKKLVGLLNDIFRTYDKLCIKYGIEKIKTIGDSYMAIAGLFQQGDGSLPAQKIMSLGIDMIRTLDNFNETHNSSIEVRCGINTGSCVGGVIGFSKIAFDCWGDSINQASRFESTSIPGCIQVGKTTYDLIKDQFTGFTVRHNVEIKGIGKMTTWIYNVSQHDDRTKVVQVKAREI